MNVEIWSDVVCPWCYIGKRRFEKALARFPHRDDVTVRFRSFELTPSAPDVYPGTLNEMLAAKMRVSSQQAARMNDRVSAIAAEEGLEYRLDVARPGNTVKAHRLLHLALEKGVQERVKERLMQAYFSEGQPIGDTETLVRLANDAGLDADEARAALSGDAYIADVRADEELAAELGITGVPFFVIDERYGVSGAQPTDAFLHALRTAWNASHPLTVVGADADSDAEIDTEASICEDDSSAI
ncbi:MAG TPA: DsbA family oxidoreductase [Ktedonobacterales bacterium]|nr:DsbA family oxidoreductase [Ktedonobacterales bacterium]